MEAYPTIAFLLRWGQPLAIGIAAMLPLAALVLLAQGWSLLVVPAGAVAGIVLFGLLRSYLEVLRVISDTLIPK
jgi:hypothetical protein